MDLTSTKSTSSTSNVPQTLSLSAKMKRLQIEEHLLLQSISKCISDGNQTEAESNGISSSLLEFKAFAGKTKNSFREIKLLFQDIKTSTSSKEMLETLDIEDVKKSTIELENRIKAFKVHLQSELARLKSEEDHLNQSINENPVEINKLKRQPRVQTAKYNEIVPSPVKTMMTSPFKCLEVQEFQEFMMNSANRYGGWDEYHHNIFVNHWQKYFGNQRDIFYDAIDGRVENTPVFSTFLDDLLPKLLDIREEEVISHIKWYSKFIHLKERQQKAIDKWRSNRKVMKSAKVDLGLKDSNLKNKMTRRKSTYNHKNKIDSSVIPENVNNLVAQSIDEGKVSFRRKCYSEDRHSEDDTNENAYGNSTNEETQKASNNNEDGHNQALLNFQKSTKQWNIRVNSKDLKVESNVYNVENIKKLRIPTWRTGL